MDCSIDESYLREAILLARDRMRENAGGPFGAIVARDDGLVARGEKIPPTFPRMP